MVFDNPTCSVNVEPINMVPQSAANTQVACSVSTAVQPVPGYLVSKIQAGQYVDFNLLGPKNLKKLPTEEPSQFQLSKLLRSDLQNITTFADWSEAWAVYVGVLAKDATANISSLISYFLLLSTASRDVPGSGWLEYDAAFRKQVVNNPSENWGEVIPTLWMTTVLSQGSLKNSIREGNSMTASKSSLPCFKWNDGECTMARCRYAHNVCSVCCGAHKKKNCQTQVPCLPPAVSESNFSGGPAPQGSRKRAQPNVNDLIPDSQAEVSYTGIPEAIDLIIPLGKGALLAKFDIRRAYRLLPVKSQQRHMLVGPPNSNICKRHLEACFSLCETLGVPIAQDKTEGPSTCITYLGFKLDSVKQELQLPQEKLVQVRAKLSVWKNRKTGKKRELLSLIGLLQHCCQAIVLGRPFLRRLIDRAHSVSEFHHFVKLSCWEQDDIKWWFKLLQSWNGKSLFFFPTWENAPKISVTSDAAGSIGFAAIYETHWFAGVWPIEALSINIASKELIPIVLSAHIWGNTWSRKRIAFRCDNMAVVLLLRQGSCKDRHLAFLLRELTILAILHSFTFTAIHIPGARNEQADALSRSDFQAFFRAVPTADTSSIAIPEGLLQHLLFPPWTSHGKHS
eukprot:gene7294-12994_t